MKLNRFRMIVVGRVLLLGASIYLLFFLSSKPEFIVTKIMVVMLVIFQLIRLIHFVEKTNRELNRFFESIQNDDFTQTFSTGNMGDSFAQLKESFDRVTRKFINLRFEKEEHFRYLQTVVEHVGVGLISYTADGEVELINKAAKRLFNTGPIKNIRSLEPLSKSLVETLLTMKTGEKASQKIQTEQKTIYLSMNATQFIVKDKRYTGYQFRDRAGAHGKRA